jgi:hypothetical protein
VFAGLAGNDCFSKLVLSGGSRAEGYNFGERPAAGGTNLHGQAATAGFWQGPQGQGLIRALNGGPGATQLGNWLAATFPNLYGGLAGKTNAAVAAFYQAQYALGGNRADAQVLATALAVYVTNRSLAGTTAAAYGFQVSAYGLGAQSVKPGGNGAPFGAASSSLTVLDLLLAADERSKGGLLFDRDGNGKTDSAETGQRAVAAALFALINDAGGIPAVPPRPLPPPVRGPRVGGHLPPR